MDRLGPLALLILLVPGITLLMALRIFYRKHLVTSNFARMALSLAAWVLIVLAVLGAGIGSMALLSAWYLPLLIIGTLMLVDRFRRSEHQALLGSLAFAADKGVPLPEAARAYAQENSGDTGVRALHLAERLEAGASLAVAAREARLRLGTPMRLAVNLSDAILARGVTLRTQLTWGAEADIAFRTICNRLLYLFVIFQTLLMITTFVMIKIVPVYQKMFEEFGLLLPAPTEWMIRFSRHTIRGGWIYFFILWVAATFAAIIGLFYYTGWYDFPVFRILVFLFGPPPRAGASSWRWLLYVLRILLIFPVVFTVPWMLFRWCFFSKEADDTKETHPADDMRVMDLGFVLRGFAWRYDASLVLRSLALLLKQNVPLPQALVTLANVHPRGNVRRRLTNAAIEVEMGGDWKQALRSQWLLGSTEAALLSAAERAGNLPWALDEMGESLMRRLTYRLTIVHQVLFPIVLFTFAAFVGFFCVAMMLPLISLIQGLT